MEETIQLASDVDGQWVTINGVHVLIKDGKIIKGPAHMMGKTPGEAGKSKPAKSEKTPSDKSSSKSGNKHPSESAKAVLARQTSRLVGADVQRYSEEHCEPILAKGVNGVSLRDNEPVDVMVVEKGVVKHGVELKTMTDNKAGKVYMKQEAIDRKRKWMRENRAEFHTVVFDDHEVKDAGGAGKHNDANRGIYYKRGWGRSLKVKAMYKCKDMGELRTLMNTATKDLPGAAKPATAYPRLRK